MGEIFLELNIPKYVNSFQGKTNLNSIKTNI